jgi:hypothetical protein
MLLVRDADKPSPYRRQLATPADDSYGSAAAYVDGFRRAAAERS